MSNEAWPAEESDGRGEHEPIAEQEVVELLRERGPEDPEVAVALMAPIRYIINTMASSTDKQRLRELAEQFPRQISVRVQRASEGGFVAEVQDFPGCVTQAETLPELIEMVNDAVATVFEVPREYLSHVASYMPPLDLARRLSEWPDEQTEGETVQLSRV